jgi:hypothetical protein
MMETEYQSVALARITITLDEAELTNAARQYIRMINPGTSKYSLAKVDWVNGEDGEVECIVVFEATTDKTDWEFILLPLYERSNEDAARVAQFCDTVLDRSGVLLGKIREASAKRQQK